jgi:hypothetical protein
VRTVGLGSKTGAVERTVKELTGTISREHTSSTISSMGSGSETENDQSRRRVPERRHRFAPVIPVEVGASLRHRHRLAIANQTGAPLTRGYFGGESDKVAVAESADVTGGPAGH